MPRYTPTRRRVLQGAAGTGLSLSFIGSVTAAGKSQYVVTGGTSQSIERAEFSVEHELAGSSVFVVRGPADAADDIRNIGGVEDAATDARLKLEEPELEKAPQDLRPGSGHTETSLFPLMWDKQVTDVSRAHDYATGDGTRLAIVDTGIDPDHPDLAANVNETESKLFSSGNPVEEDDNPWDSHGHGTHVAGTAAATSDAGAVGTGIVGSAPDAELVSAKVFWFEDPEDPDEDPLLTTTTADILRAINYAAEIGADAANMSLGTPPIPPQGREGGIHTAYQRTIQHATREGTVVVASAGNSAANLQQGGQFTLPNSVPGALSVSATAPNDELTFYSNFGTNEIDVGAPGGGYETLEKTLEEDPDEVEWPFPTNLVLSSVPPEVYGTPYAYFAGTSMASPQVTGLVGLVRELNPEMNADQVEGAIKHGAELVRGQSDPEFGAGRINALNTVERVGGSGGDNGNGNGQ